MLDHDLKIQVGMFVFIKNKTRTPWIGHITATFENSRQITVEWMCTFDDLNHVDPYRHQRCRNEWFLTPLCDRVDLDTIEDVAEVNFHHNRCDGESPCWRQRYDPNTGHFAPERLLPSVGEDETLF